MQSTILAVVVAFVVLFAARTSASRSRRVRRHLRMAILVLALVGFGVIGALLNHPPDG